jgi:hypothetical protein
MVPTPLRRACRSGTLASISRHAAGALAACLVLLAPAGCRRAEQAASDEGDASQRALAEVRLRYDAPDATATGGWTWAAADGTVYVLIDVQSTTEDVVQGRLDLWVAAAQGASMVGRSATMPLAASFEAYAFEDVTGDGLPDFFGSVVDSAETAYAIFLPGATGLMVEEIEANASGWRFSTDAANLPELVRGPQGACALKLWADTPTPDGQAAGWRYLALLRRGQLGAPNAVSPSCGGDVAPSP